MDQLRVKVMTVACSTCSFASTPEVLVASGCPGPCHVHLLTIGDTKKIVAGHQLGCAKLLLSCIIYQCTMLPSMTMLYTGCAPVGLTKFKMIYMSKITCCPLLWMEAGNKDCLSNIVTHHAQEAMLQPQSSHTRRPWSEEYPQRSPWCQDLHLLQMECKITTTRRQWEQ